MPAIRLIIFDCDGVLVDSEPLAMRVLQGEFGEGDTVRVDAAGGELRFESTRAGATA